MPVCPLQLAALRDEILRDLYMSVTAQMATLGCAKWTPHVAPQATGLPKHFERAAAELTNNNFALPPIGC